MEEINEQLFTEQPRIKKYSDMFVKFTHITNTPIFIKRDDIETIRTNFLDNRDQQNYGVKETRAIATKNDHIYSVLESYEEIFEILNNSL